MGYKIAITGGIGSGKSTVCDIIKAHGYKVFSCDEIYKQLLCDVDYVKRLAGIFPDVVRNNCIDAKKLASIVFDDETALKKLNAIAHPMIMKRLLNDMAREQDKLVFAEVPLLFECGYEHLFDKIIVVERDIEERITSVIKRSHLTREEVSKRMQSQFAYDTNEAKTHYKKLNAIILKNKGDLAQLEREALLIINSL